MVKAYDIVGWQVILFVRVTLMSGVLFVILIKCALSLHFILYRLKTFNNQLSQTTMFVFLPWSASEWGHRWTAAGLVWTGTEKRKSLSSTGVRTQSHILHNQNLETYSHYNKSVSIHTLIACNKISLSNHWIGKVDEIWNCTTLKFAKSFIDILHFNDKIQLIQI
jgi:hypothetical protein